MNKEHMIGIAGNIFGALETVSEDVYKGILKVNAKDAGVYYIDLTEKLADDFDAYQERILAKEYYNTPGSLQWNYYFLLLQDQVAKETKTKIENNDKYARKYVFNEEEFQDFFNLEKSSGDLDSNIIVEWKQALDKAGLQEIYSDAKQVDVISRFEANTAKKIRAEKNTAAKSATDDMIRSVSRLTLKPDYRKYPVSERNFNFGKVNLIKGINGVGKTSLFEAIELIICGRSFRNPVLKEKNNCIEAVFNNSGTVVKYDGTSTEPYRDRDLRWYSSSYTRDNYLYISFNRYNFFNADDGRRFSSSNSDEEVKLALFNIVLGPEYDYIAGRMQKIYDKLRLTHNKISAEVQKAKSDVESADKIIKKYKNSDALKAMQKAVSRNITELQFLKKELNPENDHTEIEEINNNIAAICAAILEQKNAGNLKDLDGLIEDFKRKDAIFKNFHVNLSGLIEKIQTDRQKESAFKADSLLLENALKYFADERFFSLERLESKLKDQIAEINKVEFLVEIFKELDPGSHHSEKTIEA
ncbi:MAG TPA: hypothetical protein DIT07_13205, partial [Sphingobacteriaceae bacterium]|nr:hypothetical protein [Sphingobacteriaceae bacterium]